jgi:hypothetical protein
MSYTPYQCWAPVDNFLQSCESADEDLQLECLQSHVAGMKNATKADASEPRRIVPPQEKKLAPHAIDDPAVRPALCAALYEAITKQSLAGAEIWNEFSLDKPVNTDWPVYVRPSSTLLVIWLTPVQDQHMDIGKALPCWHTCALPDTRSKLLAK